jgi:ferredoxin-NADP reductase/Na+-translocating ferredoxin:NAD+ oxidoreductase RnfD subunit
MLAYLNRLLGRVTMYRLTLYALTVVVVVAAALGFTHHLYYSGTSILASAAVLVTTTCLTNLLLSFLFQATANAESSIITGLILTLALAPANSTKSFLVLVLAGSVAMASKYFLSYHHRHIANPAAIALVILDLLGGTSATWWVATPVLLPITILAGVIVVYRLKLMQMVIVFGAVATIMVIAITSLHQPLDLTADLKIALASYPILYLGLFMLVEPSTMPQAKTDRYIYACLVGLIFGAQQNLGFLSTTPELALVAGNIYAFTVSFKSRVRMKLVEKTKIARDTYELRFIPDRPIHFIAGQYLEWTLNIRWPDLRGNRRTFTVASAPSEKSVHVGVKIGPGRRSTFKRYLEAMAIGDSISVANPSGDFILPKDSTTKLVWLAGGIGITPFRAMAGALVQSKQKRDIVLIHQGSDEDSFAYRPFFETEGKRVGIRPLYLATKPSKATGGQAAIGPLDTTKLVQLVPDYTNRHYYLSGPTGLIQAQARVLRAAGIHQKNIRTDDFTGF